MPILARLRRGRIPHVVHREIGVWFDDPPATARPDARPGRAVLVDQTLNEKVVSPVQTYGRELMG